MAVPNQRTIIIHRVAPGEKNFVVIKSSSLQNAMINLRGETLRMWLYLVKNKDGFSLELSKAAAANWGIKKDSYYTGIAALEAAGYLKENEDGTWDFYEDVSEIPTEQSVKTSQSGATQSVKPTAQSVSALPTEQISQSAKPTGGKVSGKPTHTLADLMYDFSTQSAKPTVKISQEQSEIPTEVSVLPTGEQVKVSEIPTELSEKPYRNNIIQNNINRIEQNNNSEFFEELSARDYNVDKDNYVTLDSKNLIVKSLVDGKMYRVQKINPYTDL